MKSAITLLLLLASLQVYSQCDSVRVIISNRSGDCGYQSTKIVERFNSSGDPVSTENYQSDDSDWLWKRTSRELFFYDPNGRLITRLNQDGNDTGWADVSRTLTTYNSFSSILSITHQNYISSTSSWQTTIADSMSYDAQGHLLSDAHYSPAPTSKSIYINSATDTILIEQLGDTSGNWVNNMKYEKHYTGSQLTQFVSYQWQAGAWVGTNRTDYFSNSNSNWNISFSWMNNTWEPSYMTINFFTGSRTDSISNYLWINNSWAGDSRTLYSYAGSLVDSVITQIMNSVWVNQTLITFQYDASNNVTQTLEMHWDGTAWENVTVITNTYNSSDLIISSYYQTWQDTGWVNATGYIYDYGPLDMIIHAYQLIGNDTGWIFVSQSIHEVDANGYPSYVDELSASYDGNGNLQWTSMYGPQYYTYSQTGLLLNWQSDPIPGGPHDGYNVYVNGILVESHSSSETMGGLTCNIDTYIYFADILGDSLICSGNNTLLFTDSCSGWTYQWSNGGTSASIATNSPGTYYVDVTHQNGMTYRSPSIRLKVIPTLPYVPIGNDSTFSACANAINQLYAPQQFGVTYQWYRNDSILPNQTGSVLNFNQNNLIDGDYYLCATNVCGTDTSSTTTVQPLPFPPVPFVSPAGATYLCSSDSITLTSTPGLSYKWYPGLQTTQSISVSITGNYYVWVYDTSGCRSQSSVTTIHQSTTPLNINIGLNNGILQSNWSGPSQWFLNGDSIPGATQGSLLPVATGYYSFAAGTSNSCDIFTDSIYINPSVLNVGIPHVAHLCANSSVGIGANMPYMGGTPPYSYSWTPNTNIVSNNNGAAIVSNLTSDQTYVLTITDSLGNTASDSVRVILDLPVKPALFTSSQSRCLDDWNPLRINYNGDPYTVQSWTVNNILVNTHNNFMGIYGSGIYQVNIKNRYGCPVSSDPDTIIMHSNPAPPQIHAILDSNACMNGQGTLWINPQPNASYTWYRYPNAAMGSDSLINVNIPVLYEIEMTDSNGCSSTSYFDFDLFNETIHLTVTPLNSTICDSNVVSLYAGEIQGWNYEWYDWNGNNVGSGVQYASNVPGTYDCIATSPAGCTASSYGNINPGSSHTVTVTNNAGLLTATQIQDASYQWFFNGVVIPGAMNYYLPASDSGVYYVRVTGWDGFGNTCPGYSNNIYHHYCVVTAPDALTCTGQCDGMLSASAFGNGNFSYQWSTGATTQIIGSLCPGIYTISATDSTGCTSIDTAYIQNNPVINSTIVTHTNCSGCSDGSIQVNLIGAANSITWTPPIGSLNNNIIENLPAGIYTICATDLNGCTGCHTDTLVDGPLSILVPESKNLQHYPNPVNDKFVVKGLPEHTLFEVRFYDEAGRIVEFHSTTDRQFDLTRFSSGIYIVEFKSADAVYQIQVVKE